MDTVVDGLSTLAITCGLRTRFVGQIVSHYPRLPSTMEVARKKVQQGALEGTVVVADEQSAGKGRLDRVWLSPEGSLSLSIVLYPRMAYLSYIIMMASLAVVRAVKVVTGLRAQIKWPNDVLIGGKKVCGILVESGIRDISVDYTIIGIGVNVNLKALDIADILPVATSLSDELGKNVSRLELLRHLLVEVENLYLLLPDGETVYREWRDNLITLGRRVHVSLGEVTYDGIAEAVAKDGSLLLRGSDGSLSRILAGDVSLCDLNGESSTSA
jgi:BirA family biotin operon repressor/biotin-[acetyl-CoA-carboxylase] ligase